MATMLVFSACSKALRRDFWFFLVMDGLVKRAGYIPRRDQAIRSSFGFFFGLIVIPLEVHCIPWTGYRCFVHFHELIDVGSDFFWRLSTVLPSLLQVYRPSILPCFRMPFWGPSLLHRNAFHSFVVVTSGLMLIVLDSYEGLVVFFLGQDVVVVESFVVEFYVFRHYQTPHCGYCIFCWCHCFYSVA